MDSLRECLNAAPDMFRCRDGCTVPSKFAEPSCIGSAPDWLLCSWPSGASESAAWLSVATIESSAASGGSWNALIPALRSRGRVDVAASAPASVVIHDVALWISDLATSTASRVCNV